MTRREREIKAVLLVGGRLWRGQHAARNGGCFYLVPHTGKNQRVRQATVEALQTDGFLHQETHGEGTDEVYVAHEHRCEICKANED